MKISQRISSLRNQFNLSQEQLAQKVGVTRQTISRWESELSIPDYSKIEKLSEVFNMTVEEFLQIVSINNQEVQSSIQKDLIEEFARVQERQMKKLKTYIIALLAVIALGFGVILYCLNTIKYLQSTVIINPPVVDPGELDYSSVTLDRYNNGMFKGVIELESYQNDGVVNVIYHDQTIPAVHLGNGIYETELFKIDNFETTETIHYTYEADGKITKSSELWLDSYSPEYVFEIYYGGWSFCDDYFENEKLEINNVTVNAYNDQNKQVFHKDHRTIDRNGSMISINYKDSDEENMTDYLKKSKTLVLEVIIEEKDGLTYTYRSDPYNYNQLKYGMSTTLMHFEA